MIDEFTLDDPGALAHPVQMKFTAHAQSPGSELMEFICTENNQVGLAGGYTPGTGTSNEIKK